MSEEDDLARRFLALWSEYLTALLADPKMAEPVNRWMTLAGSALRAVPPGEAGTAGTASPPRPAADAAAAAGASGQRDDAVAQLARRVDELGNRVAALEQLAKPR